MFVSSVRVHLVRTTKERAPFFDGAEKEKKSAILLYPPLKGEYALFRICDAVVFADPRHHGHNSAPTGK
jgi:hypothetical protein